MTLLEKINHFKIPLSFKHLRILFILLIIGMFSAGVAESYKDGEFVWKIARNESGELGWNILIFIIFSSLFSKIFTKTKILKQLLPLRKEAGILIFLIVLAHSLFHFLRAGVWGDWGQMYFQAIDRNWVILLGTIAFAIMFPLFLTSCSYAVKKMGYKSWKCLQRMSHVVFILAAIHIAFTQYPGKGEIDFNPLIILGVYFAGYIYLFWKSKK